MRVVKIKPYKPWYVTNKNKFVRMATYGDVDRMGNLYMLDVYESTDKDGDLVQDIVRVNHVCNLSEDGAKPATAILTMAMHGCAHAWPRAIESGNIRLVADYLQRKIDAGFKGMVLPMARDNILKALENHNAQ